MGLNLNRYKKRKESETSRSSGGGGGDFWRPSAGKNIIRVYSFEHTLTDEDFELGRYDKDEAEAGETVTDIDTFCPIHFINGNPHNCEGPKCQYCSDARKTGDKNLKRRDRYYLNAFVSMEGGTELKDESLRIATLAKTVYDEILGYVTDDDYGADVLGAEGRDFIIDYNPDAQGSDMYTVKLRDEKKSENLSDLDLKPRDLYAMDNLKPGFVGGKDKKPTTTTDEDEEPAKSKKGKDDKPKRFGREKPKAEVEYEVGEILCFDDTKLGGTIIGELVAIEEDKKSKKDWYILKGKVQGQKNAKEMEYEAEKQELYRPQEETKQQEEEETPKRQSRR